MKNLKIITLVLATLLSCSSQNDSEPDTIIGQWELIARTHNNNWEDVENSYNIQFTQSLNYSSTSSPICPSNPSNNGTYSIYSVNENSFFEVVFQCSEMDTGIFELEYLFNFKNNFLIISPTTGCDEGCALRFKKIE